MPMLHRRRKYGCTAWAVSGYFPNGLSGEPGSAWTADGQIVASLVTASMIRTGLLQSLNGESWIDLDNGTFSFGNGSLKWNGVTFEAVSAERISKYGSGNIWDDRRRSPA